MGLYKKLDLWSVMDGLEEIQDYYYGGNENDSQYWDYYSEQINEMGNIAADMWNELEELKRKLWYELPMKKLEFYEEDDCTATETAWFNTATCMLSDTDMATLLENEGDYCAFEGEEIEEKQKRIKALERLTKRQQMFLYTEVIGFITRYLELRAAFETITAVIRELEYHQSFVMTKDGVIAPDEAYL